MIHPIFNKSMTYFGLSSKLLPLCISHGLALQFGTRRCIHSHILKSEIFGLSHGLQYSEHFYPRNRYNKNIASISITYFNSSICGDVFKRKYIKLNHNFISSKLLFDKILLRTNQTNIVSCRYIKYNSIQYSVNNSEESQENEKNINHVRQLVSGLSVNQKRELLIDLQLEEAAERKQEAEEKLASWHWRSKFGRPTSVHPSTVDPSGTYCEIPQDWLMKKVAESSKVTPPTFSDLRKIAIFNALPFVGFGFLDNFIMIVAGDYIDLTIGIYLGISTMAAAALGNTISDLAGIGSAFYVEIWASKIGVRPPDLSKAQQDMPSSRRSANIGRGVGVCIGCILGMFPLLFLTSHPRTEKHKKGDESKQEKEE